MPRIFIPAGTDSRTKCLTTIKRYLPDVTDADFRTPIKLDQCTYIWTCHCGCEIVSHDGLMEIWPDILVHLTTDKHGIAIREKVLRLTKTFQQLEDKLCPE